MSGLEPIFLRLTSRACALRMGTVVKGQLSQEDGGRWVTAQRIPETMKLNTGTRYSMGQCQGNDNEANMKCLIANTIHHEQIARCRTSKVFIHTQRPFSRIIIWQISPKHSRMFGKVLVIIRLFLQFLHMIFEQKYRLAIQKMLVMVTTDNKAVHCL